jgi:hypothetical protein
MTFPQKMGGRFAAAAPTVGQADDLDPEAYTARIRRTVMAAAVSDRS